MCHKLNIKVLNTLHHNRARFRAEEPGNPVHGAEITVKPLGLHTLYLYSLNPFLCTTYIQHWPRDMLCTCICCSVIDSVRVLTANVKQPKSADVRLFAVFTSRQQSSLISTVHVFAQQHIKTSTALFLVFRDLTLVLV